MTISIGQEEGPLLLEHHLFVTWCLYTNVDLSLWPFWGMVTLILNLNIRWRWKVRFRLRPPPPPPGKEPLYPLSMWLIGPQIQSRRLGGEKISHSCYIPRFIAFGLVTLRPTLSNTFQLFRRNCLMSCYLLDSPGDRGSPFLSGQWSKGQCFRTRWRKQAGFWNGTFEKCLRRRTNLKIYGNFIVTQKF